MTAAHEGGLAAETVKRAARTQERYEGDADRPLGGYLGVLASYALALAGFAAVLKLTGRRLPERLEARDLALSALATHKIARLLAKDPVTSPLRAPFTRFESPAGPSELHEEVRGHGARKVVGELLTCPFCVGHWVASGFGAGLVLAPRPTRFVASVFSTLAAADALQLVYAALQERNG